MLSQAGILPPLPPFGHYAIFLQKPNLEVNIYLKVLRSIPLNASRVLGLGADFVKSIHSSPKESSIPGLRNFPVWKESRVFLPSTAGDLFVWIREKSREELEVQLREIEAMVSEAFSLELSVPAFLYAGGKDLTGFEDGTENPKGEDALQAAFFSSNTPGLDGSSFVAVQQWEHNMNMFNRMSLEEQERSIGRRKESNEELKDAPASAHTKRTAQETFNPAAFVLRRSMPWQAEERSGLMFVAFGQSFDAFEAQLRRMAGLEDGVADALFAYSRPVNGAYFWCPPVTDSGDSLDLRKLES